MKLTCLQCGHAYEVPEGTPLQGVQCVKCGSPRSHFTEAQFLRFENVEHPAYARACELARRGEKDAAFAALKEALEAGCDGELVDNDPAFAKLRIDPRWQTLRP